MAIPCCACGGPVLKRVKLFPCPGWVSMLSAVGESEVLGCRERWSMGTPVPCEWSGDRSDLRCLLEGSRLGQEVLGV